MTGYTTVGDRTNRLRLAIWGVAALIVLAPLVAMGVTDEVRWGIEDFAFAVLLLGLVGTGLELAMRLGPSPLYRAGAAVALGTALVMLWINAAVSIVGGDGSPAGPLFLAVPAVAMLGAALARLKPAGMARAMVGTAVAQFAVPVAAQLAGLGVSGSADLAKVAVLTAGFCAMWLAAAWMFARAAR